MRRSLDIRCQRRTAVLPLVVALLLASAAGAAPERDALIRPGVGIGEVRLGMTGAQVRRVLGRHKLVNERRQLGFGVEYLELDWGWGRWTVGFQGRRGERRVVKVATTLRRERTRHRLGPGSTTRDILRVFPRAACSEWAGLGTNSSKERWVFITDPKGVRTIFVISFGPFGGPSSRPTGRVIEVKVQQPARGLAERRSACGPKWRRE
jgi:hypothetical protein